MKAISKKLLSLLVVIAMVLSMVPFGGLSIFAVETKAAETDTQSTETTYVNPGADEIQRGKDVQTAANAIEFPTAGGEYPAYCPVCEETVTWKSVQINTYVNLFSDKTTTLVGNDHLYLIAPANDHTGGVNFVTTNGLTELGDSSLCVHLNGQDVRYGGRWFINKAITLNIMGTGSLTSTGTGRTSSYGNFQLTAGATINLYGGTYETLLPENAPLVKPSSTTSYYANFGLGPASATLNIYDGVVLQSDTTNVASAAGARINMYGGKIQNGNGYQYHTKELASQDTTYDVAGGNVYLRGSSTFNMYDGTISGGEAVNGGNISVYQKAVFNQYGGKIEDGTATGLYGGNIALGVAPSGAYVADATYGGTFNQYAGEVTGGYSATSGGNIALRAGYLTVSGTVSNGTVNTETAAGWGGNIYNYSGGGSILIDGAQLLQTGTTPQACYGGNFSSGNSIPSITIQNSVISGGISARGGNLDFGNAKTVTIENCEITGGKTAATTKVAQANGGNIFSQNTATVITITDSQISGGKAEGKYGGNIYCTKGEVAIAGTTTVTGGTADQGGNICLSGTASTAADWGTLTVQGGTISGGEATYGDTIFMQAGSALNMTGGEINGQVQPANAACTAKTATITVSGEAKITGHGLDCGADGIILTDAGLTGTASIAVYQSGRPFVQYTDEAAATAAKGFYKASQTGYGVVVNSDGTLMIGEVQAEYDPDIFQPWEFDDAKAYCPVCKQDVTGWQERTASTGQDSQGHWYLAGDVTTDKDQTIYVNDSGTKMGCLNLNGHTLTMTGRIGMTTSGTTLNIMDTAGGGVVTTAGSRVYPDDHANAGQYYEAYNYAIRLQSTNTTVNLYGGTYKNTNGRTAVISVAGSGNVLNIYEGAVIDGTNTTRSVHVTAGTANLKGGTIKDGYTTGSGGNLAVENSGSAFEMTSGYIYGGNADTHGGNISGGTGTTVSILGGEVYGGVAKLQAGNIRIWGGDLTIGGTAYIHDGDAQGANTRNNNVWVQGTNDTTGQSLTISGTPTITGDVLVGNGTVTMSGAPTISMGEKIGFVFSGADTMNTWATANTQVDVSGLAVVGEKTPSIVVTATEGKVLSNTISENAETIATYFDCSDDTLDVAVNDSNQLYVVAQAPDYPDPEEGVFAPWDCGGKAYCPICGTIQDWTAVSGVTTLAAGHYYLSDNIESDSASAVLTAAAAAGETTCLHLNGKNITTAAAATSGLVLHGTGAGTLNITGEGTEILNGKTTNTDYNGRAVQWDAGILNIYTGTITRTGYRAVVLQTGGVINQRGGTIDGTGTIYNWYGGGIWMTGGEYNMYDGATIQNGKGTTAGGNVSLYGDANCTFNMYGGTVKDGEAKDAATASRDYQQGNGGNFYLRAGNKLNLYGGTVSGGKAYGDFYNNNSYGYGGNIYSYGIVTIGDGEATGTEITISGGKAGSWGGNINCQSGSTLYIKAGALITGGDTTDATYGADDTATRNYGGNICAGGSAKVYMTGGTVTAGTSYRGGNFDLSGAGTLEITGGTVSDGTSTSGGGNIFFQNASAKVTISGSNTLISGGEAPNGGSIRANNGTLTVSDGATITGGHATNNGGNLYITGGTTHDIGGIVTQGKADNNGGNMYIYNSTNSASTLLKVTVSGTVSLGEAGLVTPGGCGGNIALQGYGDTVRNAELTLTGTLEDGKAVGTGTSFGGNISMMRATLNINGGTVTGGISQYSQAGNIRCWNGDIVMTSGTVSGGQAGTTLPDEDGKTDTYRNHNIWVAGDGDMTFSGGTVVPAGTYEGGISFASSGTLTLDGNATAIDSSNYGVRLASSSKLVVNSAWTGTAGLYSDVAAFTVGQTVTNGSCTGDYTGTLMNGRGDKVAIIADGTNLVLAGYAVVDTANDTTTWGTLADALAAADDSDTVYLLAGADVTLSGETVYIDALKAINVTGTGTAYGIDPANADFTTASTGSLSGEIVESDATFDGVRYIKIADGSVHAIEMGITGVSLRPTAVGLYYKATYKCDADLAKAIDAYGVVLSVNDMPGADFADVATDQFTVREDFSDLYAAATVANTVTANSGSVFGIMKDSKSVEDNAKHGVMKIYANAYILVDGAAIYVADTENAGQKAGVALSLYDVMAKVDQKWNELNLSDTNIQQINALFDKCVAWGEVDWTFTNIKGTNA